MKNIIKIGVLLVGIFLIISAFSEVDHIVKDLVRYKMDKSMGTTSLNHKSLYLYELLLKYLDHFIKLIVGLILVFNPNILSKFYIPSKYEETDDNIHLLFILSFIYGFGIYLMIDGIINLTHLIINSLIFTFRTGDSFIDIYSLALIPPIIQIGIGYLLFKYFQKKIYIKKTIK
jgi:hypothetical protein